MAVVLDIPVHCHGLVLAALARVSLWPFAAAGGLSVAGSKQPLCVLVHDGTALRGFDLAGRPLSMAEVEGLLPGVAGTLAKAWLARNDPPAG